MLGYWLGCIPRLGHWLGCIPCWVIGLDVLHVGHWLWVYSMLGHWYSRLRH